MKVNSEIVAFIRGIREEHPRDREREDKKVS